MYWYSRCSWCGGPFNGGNCRRCTNLSFGDEFVHNPDPISNDETPEFSYPPSKPQTSSFDRFYCYGYGDPLEDGVHCQQCTCEWCRSCLREGICFICASSNENSFIEPNSFNDTSNVFTHPPQPPQYSINHQPQIIDQEWESKLYNEFMESMRSMFEEFRERLQAAKGVSVA
uniref:Uncharacterized protein n=1 Tax=Tanacetum cinerariifolium TaxID=118510 RepID=A0A6L2MYV0_TANCI|nr:hypothetical protein [Tanacetum cinerariifolium]